MSNNVAVWNKFFLAWLENNQTTIIDPKRCYPTAIIANQLFSVDEKNIGMAFGTATLWLFGIDRWYDERVYTEKLLLSKVKRVLDQDTSDEEEADLSQRLSELVSMNFFSKPDLQEYSMLLLQNTLYDGMLIEHRMRFSDYKPKHLREYLLIGRESIGVKFVNSVVLSTIFQTMDYIDRLFIEKLQNLSAEIIRLTNDSVTLEKEKQEGNQNIFTIFPEYESSYISLISDKRKELLQLQCPQDKFHNRFYQYVVDLVEKTLQFYSHSDFYDEHDELDKKQNEFRPNNRI